MNELYFRIETIQEQWSFKYILPKFQAHSKDITIFLKKTVFTHLLSSLNNDAPPLHGIMPPPPPRDQRLGFAWFIIDQGCSWTRGEGLIHNNSLSKPHALNLCRLSHSSIRSTLQYFLFDNIVGDDSDKLKVYVAQTKNLGVVFPPSVERGGSLNKDSISS